MSAPGSVSTATPPEPTSTAERLAWAGELESLPAPWRERMARLVGDVERLEAERPAGVEYYQRPAVSVPAETRQAVDSALAVVQERLCLEPVNVIWFGTFSRVRWEHITDSLWRAARAAGHVEFEGTSPRFTHPVAIGGMFHKRYPRSVYVRADLSPQAAAKVATHEAVHLWQYHKHPRADWESVEVVDEMERQAEEAEQIFLVPGNVV